MKAANFERGDRVTVFVFDERTGGDHWPGAVRRMAGDTRVVVRLDAGFDVGAHVGDVTPVEAAHERMGGRLGPPMLPLLAEEAGPIARTMLAEALDAELAAPTTHAAGRA